MIYDILHNPRCSKSRQTLGILEDNNKEINVIKYLETPPSSEELKLILAKLNLPAEAIVRKGEALYKEKYRGLKFNEEEWIAVLVENPKLIERPIVIHGNRAVIGRPPENVETLF